MEMNPVKRVFKFGNKELEDLDPSATPEEVMEMWSRRYPSLTKGEIGGPYYEDGKEEYKMQGTGPTAVYDLKGGYGTKG